MPIYAYKCGSCGHAKDVLQKMSDAPLTQCPACGAEAFAKQVTAAGFQLKGSGWYVTDFRGGSSTSAAPAPAAQPAQAAPSAAHDAANPPLPAIDWSHALALWGDAAPLHAALQRCLDDNTDIVAQWQGLHAQAQWPALAAGAHRLRGQAGNLGLLALQQCLGQLEQAARAGDAQACAQHLDALPDLWQALRAAQSQLPAPALAAHTAPRHEPAPTAQPPALATPQHSQVLLALEEALLALEEGALPEPAPAHPGHAAACSGVATHPRGGRAL